MAREIKGCEPVRSSTTGCLYNIDSSTLLQVELLAVLDCSLNYLACASKNRMPARLISRRQLSGGRLVTTARRYWLPPRLAKHSIELRQASGLQFLPLGYPALGGLIRQAGRPPLACWGVARSPPSTTRNTDCKPPLAASNPIGSGPLPFDCIRPISARSFSACACNCWLLLELR